jgi:glucose/arabinose dehydrogenase
MVPILAAPMACAQPMTPEPVTPAVTSAAAGVSVPAVSAPVGAAVGDAVTSPSSLGPLRVTTLARGLDHPWSLAFLPDGRMLVTERPGWLRYFDPATRTFSAPIQGLPDIWVRGQGGLLDVVPVPAFANTGLIYFSYSDGGPDGKAGTAVARARLDGAVLSDVQVIFRQLPKLSGGAHFGSRLVFDEDGSLFVTLGENGIRPSAQRVDHHQGKVVRILPDGRVPTDNPWVGDDAAKPELWSIGHRNAQGAAINPASGRLWTVEHGAMGGDEVNIPRPGRNYGWPVITHGLNYDGEPIPESIGDSSLGMEQPLHYWVPSIGPSGMAFYTGMALPGWFGNAFIGGLASRELVRLDLDGDRVVGEERLLGELGWRIRDVRMGVDDALYLLTDEDDGRLLKIENGKPPPPRRTQRPPAKPPAPERKTPPTTQEE